MKKIISSLLTVAAALFMTGCYTAAGDIDTETTAVRITLSPGDIEFTSEGLTAAGDAYGTYIVVVNPLDKMNEHWTAELVDTPWAELDYYTTSPDGVVEKTLRITCTANIGYKRIGTLRITLDSGESADFDIVQTGLKADATLSLSKTSLQMMALEPDPETITFETNMAAATVAVAPAEGETNTDDWLSWTIDAQTHKITFSAKDNLSPEDARELTVVVSAGSKETSLATQNVTVRQLANETYLFLYGPGVPHYPTIDVAVQMDKADLSFSLSQYFKDGRVIIATSNKASQFPRYAVAADGTVTVLNNSTEETAAAAADFDVAGMRRLQIAITLDSNFDIENVTAAFERVSTRNAMPDSELPNYPTKDYVTRSGGAKTWMTVGLHWNGGEAMGAFKLGSGLVAGHQTGGYGNVAPYTSRNAAYDTEENGGAVKEVTDASGKPLGDIYGRLYSMSELLTGSPNGALNPCEAGSSVLINSPIGEPGSKLTDAVGSVFTLESLSHTTLITYEASAAGDAQAEADHPNLVMQIQGICPYGWHIPNVQDWKDLVWAASAQNATDYPVAATTATYNALGTGTITNFASLLFSEDWDTYNPTLKAEKRSTSAAAFGYNMFSNGWRLYKTGYDYGPGDDNPRMYTFIPIIGTYTATKKAGWRIWNQGREANMRFDSASDLGNGCGVSIRCVKNYENF
jgi:uncharacterized protein (TIGR02145 family)